LFREKLTFGSLKDAAVILAEIERIEAAANNKFSRIIKEVKDSELLVTGETDIAEEMPGLGGGFQFLRLL
jgi:adenine-specific DNA-methyltransferase